MRNGKVRAASIEWATAEDSWAGTHKRRRGAEPYATGNANEEQFDPVPINTIEFRAAI